jgi:hypothetical protein
MPYIKGGGAQKDSGLPAVEDVFHANDVYINNVLVALWQTPQASAALAKDAPATQVDIGEFDALYLSTAASLPPQNISTASIENNVVEQGYRGTPTSTLLPNPETQTTGAVPTGKVEPVESDGFGGLLIPESTPSGDPQDLAEWLRDRLDEGRRGMWNRVSPPAPPAKGGGPAISPGNPNIINMWRSIGLSQFTNNDQTAWCAGFMNFALKQCGYKWLIDASSWTIRNSPGKYGATAIPLNQGKPGDIALFSFGHVAFVYRAVNGTYSFVGGNQGGGELTAKSPNNNNPVASCVSESWAPGGTPACSPGRYGEAALVGLWRPGKV